MRRHFTDDELMALAHVFQVDTGDAFHKVTDEEVEATAAEIFPEAWRADLKAELIKGVTG